MIIKTSKLTDAIRRVSRITKPKLKYETGSADSAFAQTLICLEFFSDQKIVEVKCINEAQVFSELIDVTPEIGEESFAAAVYPNILLDVVKTADAMINIVYANDELVVKVNSKLKHKLKNKERAIDYFSNFITKPPRVDNASHFPVNAIDFRTALSYCLHAVGDRFDFVTLRSIDNSIWMAGTDGFRAAFVNDIAEHKENFNINIGTSEARNLLSVIPNDEIDVKLLVTRDKLYFSFENFSSSTLLTNTLLDIFEVLNGKEKPTYAVFKADLDFFVKAISFLSSMSAEGSNRACIAIDKDSVKMSAIAQQVGNTTWIIPSPEGNLPEEELETDFNPSFIGRYISAVNPSELSICLSENSRHPIFLESENKNQIFLFMPMQ